MVPWVLSLVSRVSCPSIYLCFLNVFGLGAGAVFPNTNGEPMAVSVRLLETFHFCLSYCGSNVSPSVAFVGCIVVFLALSFLLECVCLPSLCSPSVALVGCTVVFLGSELASLACASAFSLLPSVAFVD